MGLNDTANIAEHFNWPSSCTEIFDHDSKEFLKYLGKRTPKSIFLEPTCPIEAFNKINSLNTNKSPGLDGITAYFVKIAADVITIPFSTLCNFSFSLGIFPENMKIAKVVPLFKISNYRPIFILTCLSKVIEKLTYARLINFFNKHSLLQPNQYCFRRLSTNPALLDVVTINYDNIDKLLQTNLH